MMQKKAKELKKGDVFSQNGHTEKHTAMDTLDYGYIWVTSEENYKAVEANPERYGYGPTNSYPMMLNEDEIVTVYYSV